MRKEILVCLILLANICFDNEMRSQELTHVRGIHSIGVRGGIGTKNKYDIGLSYNYNFNSKVAMSLELDHEEALFGNSKFTSVVLLSPGIDYSVVNPWGWSYVTFNLAGSIGWDKWECEKISEVKQGIVFGANAGVGWEFIPWSFLSFVVKAQEYILFGNDTQYLKPLFSLGVRYNFHK